MIPKEKRHKRTWITSLAIDWKWNKIEYISKDELQYLLKNSTEPIYYTVLNRFAPSRKKKRILTMDDNVEKMLLQYRATH